MTEVDSHLPKYRIEERNEEIIITIEAPLSKFGEAALLLEKNVLTFDSSPYLLKIKLPHALGDSEHSFDDATKTYQIKFSKLNKPNEECLKQNDSDYDDEDKDNNEVLSLQDFINGEKISSDVCQDGETKQFYGFANKYSKMFGNLYNEFSEVVNLPDPDNTNVEERRRLRVEEENKKWCENHYLADTMETDHLDSIFEYEPPWVTTPVKDVLNNDEKEVLLELSKSSKYGELSEEEKKLSEFQLVDILFGYVYNKRTTEGDNTVESGWTINKLSSTLSWFEVFEDLKTVVTTCYTRMLSYPLFRNWDLARYVHKDVVHILKIGPNQVTRCLLEVREIFNESEKQYVLNTLYLNDLCNFTYHMKKGQSNELAAELHKLKISKLDVNRDLPLLEMAAHLTLLEEENSDTKESGMTNLIDKIKQLNLDLNSSTSCDSSDSSTSDTGDSNSSNLSSDNEN